MDYEEIGLATMGIVAVSTIVIGVFFMLAVMLGFYYQGYGTGSHVGYITATEHNKGLFFESMRVYVKTDTQSSQEDTYCVTNRSLLDELEKKSETKELVKIKYQGLGFTSPWTCGQDSTTVVSVTSTK